MIGPCDESIALIEENMELMAREAALKKSERVSERIKREQKSARQKAATTDITKFFKQVKTVAGSSKAVVKQSATSSSVSRPSSAASLSIASKTASSKPSTTKLAVSKPKLTGSAVTTSRKTSTNISNASSAPIIHVLDFPEVDR